MKTPLKWIMVRSGNWRVVRIDKGAVKDQKMRLECFDNKKWHDVRSARNEDVKTLKIRNLDGSLITFATSACDLVNIKEKKFRWVNFFGGGCCSSHASRSEADRYHTGGRIACIKVEYEKGEGL